MVCPMSGLKFVGAISLGLLTGVSYNLSTVTLPSLALLPSAAGASRTLTSIQEESTRQILTLASISSISLVTAFTFASPRNRHPYLLWTALVGLIGGQGLEYWYNGFSRFPTLRHRNADSGYVDVETEVNGEKVEAEMSRERRVQISRTIVAGIGFAMTVVGIWGDGRLTRRPLNSNSRLPDRRAVRLDPNADPISFIMGDKATDEQPLSGQPLFIRADEIDSGTSLSTPNNHQFPSSDARFSANPQNLDYQQAYAFQYTDAGSFKEEVDEWFHYSSVDQDRDHLLLAREAFEQRWKTFCQRTLDSDDASWIEVSEQVRQEFLRSTLPDLSASDGVVRLEGLCCIYYVLAGTWSLTSGLDPSACSESYKKTHNPLGEDFDAVQIEWMHRGADLVLDSGLIGPLFACMFAAAKPSAEPQPGPETSQDLGVEALFDEDEYRELSICMSSFYLLVESARARQESAGGKGIRREISALSPRFSIFLVSSIARLRWDEAYNIPLAQAIQLLWKTLLLLFGDTLHHLEAVKSVLQPRENRFLGDSSHPILTASPLDYHLFRQDITSKYPAYNPPLPLIPLEAESRTMLPVAQHHHRQEVFPATFPTSAPTGSSILHQPVHIATPAPSPPPSPVGPGGKAGKKQNYQTNQNFPFLYPPMDSSSNDLGGKGSTEFQDLMATKKWEGSDVPTSIIEAGELFASRMRMTRAMRQLWKQRDLFMKYDRGWTPVPPVDNGKTEEGKTADTGGDDLEELRDPDLLTRMALVDDFFHHALPDMQSLVIVLMKVMLSNVQDIAIRSGLPQDGNQSAGGLNRTKSNSNVTAQTLPMPPPPPKPSEMSIKDLDHVRSREISQKAVSALIFLMIKWFKMSHILKAEYLTQLLLDSNYVQLTLKYFAHQNLEDLVAFRYDRDDLSFFHYCHLQSDHPPLSPASPTPSSPGSSLDDEALPPAIAHHRRSPTSNSSGQPDASNSTLTSSSLTGVSNNTMAATASPTSDEAPQATFPPLVSHPTIDELGNPLAPLPSTPITNFSARQFLTSIHLLRILQKVTRGKAHRILFLIQFKSSQILRRILRVPEPMMRLYVLKLFKSQVPFCGRKWRQSNMRVITAIYLECTPELRDEWLAGMHEQGLNAGANGAIDGEADDAVPLEWALRGLTWWWMKRRYADVIGLKRAGDGSKGGQEIEDEERDFFQRELDALGWGLLGLGRGDDGIEVGFGEEALGVGGPSNGMNGDSNAVSEWDTAEVRSLDEWQR
ncbi:hypothetical protein DV738_g2926, partial [Chaetothyriales sp. CBS 135597]